MGLFPRLVKIPVSIFSIILAIYHWQKSKHVLKLFDQQMKTCLGFWYDGLIIEKIENRIFAKLKKKSHWGTVDCGPWLLKLLHYLGLIYVEWSHFQNWILRSLSFKLRYTINRQLPQWYSLLDCVCPIWNSINPVDIILGIVGRDEKISQVKKIMEIQRNGDSSKTETSLQVRVGN